MLRHLNRRHRMLVHASFQSPKDLKHLLWFLAIIPDYDIWFENRWDWINLEPLLVSPMRIVKIIIITF